MINNYLTTKNDTKIVPLPRKLVRRTQHDRAHVDNYTLIHECAIVNIECRNHSSYYKVMTQSQAGGSKGEMIIGVVVCIWQFVDIELVLNSR